MENKSDEDRFESIVEGVKPIMAELEQLVSTMKTLKEYGQPIPIEMREKANTCVTELEKVLGPMPWIESSDTIDFYEYYRAESKRIGRENYAARLGLTPNHLTSMANGKVRIPDDKKILIRLDIEKRLGPVRVLWPDEKATK
jgi:hypothetical protein